MCSLRWGICFSKWNSFPRFWELVEVGHVQAWRAQPGTGRFLSGRPVPRAGVGSASLRTASSLCCLLCLTQNHSICAKEAPSRPSAMASAAECSPPPPLNTPTDCIQAPSYQVEEPAGRRPDSAAGRSWWPCAASGRAGSSHSPWLCSLRERGPSLGTSVRPDLTGKQCLRGCRPLGQPSLS